MTAQNMFGAQGLVSRNASGSTTWYTFDERGNVAQRVNSGGAALSTNVYDAFGKQRSGASDVFGFGGQAGYYTDTETGLVLCTNRHYDPQSGRFLSRDPLGYDGGINLYSYTQNNPINWMDPDGTDTTDNTILATFTGLGIVTGGFIGAGGGGAAGFGVGAIPGAAVGVEIGGEAGAASGLVAIGLRHAILNMMSGGGAELRRDPKRVIPDHPVCRHPVLEEQELLGQRSVLLTFRGASNPVRSVRTLTTKERLYLEGITNLIGPHRAEGQKKRV